MEINQDINNNPQKKGSSKKSTGFWVVIILAIITTIAWFNFYYLANTAIVDETDIDFNNIQGYVGDDINHEDRNFTLWWFNKEETDSGLTFMDEGEITVKWEGNKTIEPHHPSLLKGGEEVKIVPTQVWGEDSTEIYIDSLEIISGLRDWD